MADAERVRLVQDAFWRNEKLRRRLQLAEDMARRDPVWAEKMARRHAEFNAKRAALAAVPSPSSAAAEVSAAVAAALQAARAEHHEGLNLAPTTTSIPTASVADDHDLNLAPATTSTTTRSPGTAMATSPSTAPASILTACAISDGILGARTPTTCSTNCQSRIVASSVSSAASSPHPMADCAMTMAAPSADTTLSPRVLTPVTTKPASSAALESGLIIAPPTTSSVVCLDPIPVAPTVMVTQATLDFMDSSGSAALVTMSAQLDTPEGADTSAMVPTLATLRVDDDDRIANKHEVLLTLKLMDMALFKTKELSMSALLPRLALSTFSWDTSMHQLQATFSYSSGSCDNYQKPCIPWVGTRDTGLSTEVSFMVCSSVSVEHPSHTQSVQPANAILYVSSWPCVASKHADMQFQLSNPLIPVDCDLARVHFLLSGTAQINVRSPCEASLNLVGYCGYSSLNIAHTHSWMLIIVEHLLQYGLEANALLLLISWLPVPCLQFCVLQGNPSWSSSNGFLAVLNGEVVVQQSYTSTRFLTVIIGTGGIYHHIPRGNTHYSEQMQWSFRHSLLQFRFCTPGHILLFCSALVQSENSGTINLVPLKSWFQCWRAYSCENFQWTIAWSLSYPFFLSISWSFSCPLWEDWLLHCSTRTVFLASSEKCKLEIAGLLNLASTQWKRQTSGVYFWTVYLSSYACGPDVLPFGWLQFANKSSFGFRDELLCSITIQLQPWPSWVLFPCITAVTSCLRGVSQILASSVLILEGVYSISSHYLEVHIWDTISVKLSTSTIMHAGKFCLVLGVYSSCEQFVTGSATHLSSQIFELQIPWYISWLLVKPSGAHPNFGGNGGLIMHFTVNNIGLQPTKVLCCSLLIQWPDVLISAWASFYATLQNVELNGFGELKKYWDPGGIDLRLSEKAFVIWLAMPWDPGGLRGVGLRSSRILRRGEC